MTREEAKHTVLRRSFIAFVPFAFSTLYPSKILQPSFHHYVIADAFQQMLTGGSSRLIVNTPPRSLKSFTCTVAGACWAIGRNPDLHVMVIAGNRGLARDLLDQTVLLLSSSRYRALFPQLRVSVDGATIRTSAGGKVSFSGFRQSQIGRGADIIIGDDLTSPSDAQDKKKRGEDGVWLRSEVLSRLNDQKSGRIVLVMQRLHKDDLTAHLLAAGVPCRVIAIPAIAVHDEEWTLSGGAIFKRAKGELMHPDRLPKQELQSLLVGMGAHRFKPQYQQDTYFPDNSYGEYRTGRFYYPKGHRLYTEALFGQDWFFAEPIPETAYALHELFGWEEPPRRYDDSLGVSADEWEKIAIVQQRMLVASANTGAPLATIGEVLNAVGRAPSERQTPEGCYAQSTANRGPCREEPHAAIRDSERRSKKR